MDTFISKPSKSVLVIILKTPATASEPYVVEPPFLSNSIRFNAIAGKFPMSTGDSPALVSTAVGTILLPFIKTRVRPSPRPLMFTFLIPVTIPPSMNCSDWFTAPETAVRFLTKSVISGIPDDSKSSLSNESTGTDSTSLSVAIKEPVTTTSSVSSSCEFIIGTKRREIKNNLNK